MNFEETLFLRDDEMDEFGDSGAYGDSLEEDYEEEEEEEEAEVPGGEAPAEESLLASRRGKPREKPCHERKRQRRKPLKRNPHAKRPRENLLGKKQEAGERNLRAGAVKLWRTLSCVQAPSRGSPPRLFLQICLRVRRRRFGLGTRLTPVRTSPNMLSTPRLSAL